MWTDQQILAAVDAGLETATDVLDQDRQAVLFWKEWAAIEPRVPTSQRKAIICFFDGKLSAKGLLTLRQLVGMRPFSGRADEGDEGYAGVRNGTVSVVTPRAEKRTTET